MNPPLRDLLINPKKVRNEIMDFLEKENILMQLSFLIL